MSPQKKARFLRRSQRRTISSSSFSRRILQEAAREGFQQAAARHMEVMGYNVVAEGGWVVKRYADGHTEKLSEIKPVNRNRTIVLR